jgi:hypothetical protein
MVVLSGEVRPDQTLRAMLSHQSQADLPSLSTTNERLLAELDRTRDYNMVMNRQLLRDTAARP